MFRPEQIVCTTRELFLFQIRKRSALNWDSVMNGRDKGKSNSGHCTSMHTRSEGSMNSVMFLMTDWNSNLKLFKMFGLHLLSRS
jgi:hypothetical protein